MNKKVKSIRLITSEEGPSGKIVGLEGLISEASVRLNKAALIIGEQRISPVICVDSREILEGLRFRTSVRKPHLPSLAWNAASIAIAQKVASATE